VGEDSAERRRPVETREDIEDRVLPRFHFPVDRNRDLRHSKPTKSRTNKKVSRTERRSGPSRRVSGKKADIGFRAVVVLGGCEFSLRSSLRFASVVSSPGRPQASRAVRSYPHSTHLRQL